jgi:glyoxylate reductase
MNVLVTGNLPDSILDRIRKVHAVRVNREDRPMERQALLAAVADTQGLLSMLTDRVDVELLDRAPQLRMVANCAVGFDNVDIAAASGKRIWVSNTPGVLTDSTADLAFALMLAVGRRVVEGDRRVRGGRFRHFAPFCFLWRDISGKTLGILGLGRIGRAVARRAGGFGMQVVYHNRNRLPAEEEAAHGIRYVSLETLMQTSDFISVHVPLSDATRHLVDAAAIGMMKPSAILVNTARGPVVDEAALVEALRAGRIGGAGLDVYENEPDLAPGLAELDNAVLLPHVGSASIETRTRMADMAADNLLAGLRGEVPPNCLNPGFRA